jgi:hypothetical protein
MKIHVIKQRVAIEKVLTIEIDKKTTRKRIENMLDPMINQIQENNYVCSELRENYYELKENYSELQENYTELQENYTELQEYHTEL